jgi:hypothetical protein
MEVFARLGDGWAIADGLEAVATLRSQGDPGSAALLGGAGERLRERIAMRPHPSDARINRAYLERAREQMPSEAFEKGWIEGREMRLEEAVRLALRHSQSASPVNPLPAPR